MAAIALAEDDPATAAYLLGLAEAIRGVPARGDPDVAATMDSVRAALGDDYPAAHTAGARRSVDEAIAILGERAVGSKP